MGEELTVGIAGLVAIGLNLALALDGGVPGLKLTAASARDHTKASSNTDGFSSRRRELLPTQNSRHAEISW